MNKITAILLFILLNLAIFPKSHITGGVSIAFAAPYEELGTYEVTIENNLSKVITTMTVNAVDEQEAKDNVGLNGWTVIGAKRLDSKQKETYNLSTESVNTVIPRNVDLEGGIGELPPHQPQARSLPQNSPKPQEPRVSSLEGNKNVSDNLNLLPDSPDLELILTIHFKLGEVMPIFDKDVTGILDNLQKDGKYVIFGNSDDVSIGQNASYDSNYELSYLRAEHIKRLMVEKGYSADNIKAVGLGTRYPLEKKKDSIKNRRVEIYGRRS